jgi:hypothetical protein
MQGDTTRLAKQYNKTKDDPLCYTIRLLLVRSSVRNVDAQVCCRLPRGYIDLAVAEVALLAP